MKSKPFIRTKEMEEEWEILKRELAERMLLEWRDETKEMRLRCDASKEGVGLVLEQYNGEEGRGEESRADDEWGPIMMASKKFNKSQAAWKTAEQELYSVVWAVGQTEKYTRRFLKQFL